MRTAATTPISGWRGQDLSRTIPIGSDHSMAHAVVRAGRYQRASSFVPAVQATAKARTISGSTRSRGTWEKAVTGMAQVATAYAAPRPGRFCTRSMTALPRAYKRRNGDAKTAATRTISLT
jgi:hypothetical protein